MDGVLFPTEPIKFKAYQQVFQDFFDIDIEENPERLGMAEAKTMELFLKMYNKQADFKKIPELIQKKREVYYDILQKQNFEPIAGVKNFLDELKNNGVFKIGLATASDQKSTDILIKKFGFGKYFDSILSFEQVAKPKPDPEIYLESSQRLELLPSDCVVFEDTLIGLEAAERAGMISVGIATGIIREKLFVHADLVVSNFNEINPEMIKELFEISPK